MPDNPAPLYERLSPSPSDQPLPLHRACGTEAVGGRPRGLREMPYPPGKPVYRWLRGIVGRGESRGDGAYAPPALRQSNSGMPIALALSARFSVTPEPGNTTTPIGRASSSWSLRLNGAAF